MNEKQFKQLAHDLVVDIVSTIGTFTMNLELTDDNLAKTQKLVKKFDEALTEFIDSRKPKFKVGDYVVEQNGDVISKIEEVINGDFWGPYYKKAINFFGNFGAYIRDKNIKRYATPEEIAEYEVALIFHKHGRKPFEVKDGDLLENKFGKYIAHKSLFVKENFTVEGNAFLKTAEEVDEWVGADNE